MSLTAEAIYENGTLKLVTPLPLTERQRVRVTVVAKTPSIVEAYGIMGWTGDAATLERFALDPEFDPFVGV